MKLVLIACLCLSGCSLWDLVKPSSGLSVDTEIVAGDQQKEIATGAVVGKREATTNTADQITQTYNTVDQGMSLGELILICVMSFLLGWLAMPSARQMWFMFTQKKAPPERG